MMFKIEYNMFGTLLIEDVQETKAETLPDAETMAIIGCCERLDILNACIRHISDLEYDVLLENAVIGRVKITVLSDIVNVSA